jgi:hypothetical protein
VSFVSSTLFAGPNEEGKSTIFEAVRRALFDRARGQAAWVNRLVPYGVPGAMPQVSLDFEHQGRRIRVTKRFGTRGSTELSEFKSGAWTRVAANEEAEERLLELLGARASTKRRDGAGPESWGAFQWLFVAQDERTLPNGTSDATAFLGLDRAGLSAEFEAVHAAIGREYSAMLTPTGKPASSSELKQVEDALQQLRESRELLEKELRKVAELERKHEEVQEELPRLREDAVNARAEWEKVDSEAVDLSGAEANLRAAEEARSAADQRAVQAVGVVTERRRREKEAQDAADRLNRAQLAQTRASVVLEQRRKGLEAAREAAKQLGDAVAEKRRRLSIAQRELQIRQAEGRLTELDERLQRAEELDSKIRKLEASRVASVPNREEVSTAHRLAVSVEEKRRSGFRLGLQIEIEGNPDLHVFADGSLLSDSQAVALDAVVVEAPNGGNVTVRGETSEAQRLADEAADAGRELEGLLVRFGVDRVAELQRLYEDELERRNMLASLQRERRAIEQRGTAEIQTEVERLKAELTTFMTSRAASAAGLAFAEVSDAEVKAFITSAAESIAIEESAYEAERQNRENIAALYREASDQERRTSDEFQNAHALNEAAQRELDAHRNLHGSTEKCTAERDQVEQALSTAAGAEAAARQRLSRLKSDAESRRKTARRTYERLSESLQAAEARSQQLAEAIEQEVAAGNYSRLADIERRIEAEEARLGRLALRAEALKVLKRTADLVRSRVVDRVVGPIRNSLDERLASITAGRYRLAELDAQLQPMRLRGDVQCEIEDGSQGLRELVTTLIRTSVASHLAAEEPQTLILDDPCVHVSPTSPPLGCEYR